jgi:hypothetical protein
MRGAAAYGLLLLGLAQMAGSLAGIEALRGIGAASAASPAPKVFTTVNGLETFSTRFALGWREVDGLERSIIISPDLYAGLRGPYNRRNVYGAVLAYGPLLADDPRTAGMFGEVARYALCGEAPLLRELGLDPAHAGPPFTIRYTPRAGGETTRVPLGLTVTCP